MCGSNGISFPNHCELHRTACLEGKKISIKHDGTCKGVYNAISLLLAEGELWILLMHKVFWGVLNFSFCNFLLGRNLNKFHW